MIPHAAPSLRIARFRKEIDSALASVLDGKNYILGSAVENFERAFASIGGAEHVIGVSSGTDALALSLRALGIGPGDEVIVPALTFSASAQAVLHCGAVPHFVDVDPITRCIDVQSTAAAIGAHTAAIMPVHLFGFGADMISLMALAERHGLAVVEDCAQSCGATMGGRRLGSFGHAAAYSFYPTKNLGCVGDGGAVVTKDAGLAARLRSLRNYGFAGPERISHSIGFNARLDEIQAAVLLALLPHCEAGNTERREIAAQYNEILGSCGIGLPSHSDGCIYHQYAITCDDRDELARHLAENGIGSAVHYTPGLHRHPAFAVGVRGPLPVTETLSGSLLSLPIQPEVASAFVDRIAATVRNHIVQ